jgi:ribosomal protein L31
MNQIVHLIISIVFSAVNVAVLAFIALNSTKGTDMAAKVMFSSSLDIDVSVSDKELYHTIYTGKKRFDNDHQIQVEQDKSDYEEEYGIKRSS